MSDKGGDPIAYLRRVTTETEAGCWVGRTKRYGTVQVEGKPRLRHRFAWEAAFGQIPDGMFVCHRCNNKPCCNPAHLYLGTASDNIRDAWRDGLNPGNRGGLHGDAAKNAAKTHCVSGHPLSGENCFTTWRGHRGCRACQREHTRRYKAKVRGFQHASR